jgi:hypothetical protein
VLVVVNPGQKPSAIPATLEGVRTRIIEASASAPQGTFELAAGARLAPALDSLAVGSISTSEMAHAKVVHAAHVTDLMKQPGVQGVGITSSADAPGEAALMIYLVRGVQHSAIPEVIDGLRTRIRESSRFTAGRHRGEVSTRGCSVPQTKPTETLVPLQVP